MPDHGEGSDSDGKANTVVRLVRLAILALRSAFAEAASVPIGAVSVSVEPASVRIHGAVSATSEDEAHAIVRVRVRPQEQVHFARRRHPSGPYAARRPESRPESSGARGGSGCRS